MSLRTVVGSGLLFSVVIAMVVAGAIGGLSFAPRAMSPHAPGPTLHLTTTRPVISVGAGPWPVTFTESGLPGGTRWGVALNYVASWSTTNSIQFIEPNGSYPFAVAALTNFVAAPGAGTIHVNGAPVTQSISFTEYFTVSFVETGLPSYGVFNVTLNGTTAQSTGHVAQFSVPNGIYAYSIEQKSGYTVAPASGTVTVNAMNVTVPVTYSPTSSGGSPLGSVGGLPAWALYLLIALAVAVAAILLVAFLGCPNLCEPEGTKKNCTARVRIETSPCGVTPDWIRAVQEGADIMTFGKEIAKHIEIAGETYSAFLEAMPGWVKVAKKLMEEKLGIEIWATVQCSWLVCEKEDCWGLWKRLNWVSHGIAYGPFKLKPPQGHGFGSGDECFRPQLEPADLFADIKAALDASKEVKEAIEKCTKVCQG